MSLLQRVVGVSFVLAFAAVAPSALALDGGPPDAGLMDASVDAGACEAGSGLSCEQCDVSGFAPTTLAMPLGPMAAQCSDADISAFITACGISTGTQTTCSTWQSSTASACVKCMLTPDTAASWGLLSCSTTSCSYNSGGCIDLALGQVSQEKQAGGSGSCGDLVQAAFGCEDYACSACTVSSDFTSCVQSAVMNECVSYATSEQDPQGPCGAIDGSASETACFPQSDSDIMAMAELFCGGLVVAPDAGTDAGNPPDAGKPDSGTAKDAGGSDSGSKLDAGGDAGSTFNNGSGCHCDAAGGSGSENPLLCLGTAVVVFASASRRRRKREQRSS